MNKVYAINLKLPSKLFIFWQQLKVQRKSTSMPMNQSPKIPKVISSEFFS